MWGDGPTSNPKNLKPTALHYIQIFVNYSVWCGNEYIPLRPILFEVGGYVY
jgi:hypothetical protein